MHPEEQNPANPRPTSSTLDDQDLGAAFPALMRGLTTKRDVRAVANICRRIMGDIDDQQQHSSYHGLLATFFEEVVDARLQLPPHVLATERSLPSDWHNTPWYVTYVQCLGVDHGRSPQGTFDTLRRMIPYIRRRLGFKNLLLLPHYESPMADGGCDVSSYCVRDSLGGAPAFDRFMAEARAAGLRVATDAVFNHTSTKHEWFQQAISGDERYQRFYLQRNGREKIEEWQRDGEVWCKYRDVNGCITERAVAFPDIDRTHGLWVEINNQTHQFYRTFHPFQVDLNLQNVDVLRELMRVLARDVRSGVLGKRMDCVEHWIKKPGSSCNSSCSVGDNNRQKEENERTGECHAVLALFKQFLRHVHQRTVVLAPVARAVAQASTYAGSPTLIRGTWCAGEGDGIFCYDMQAGLREAVYLQTVVPFWRRVFSAGECLQPHGFSVWLNLIEHHDAIYLGFHPRPVRRWIADYITSHNGVLGSNGMLAAGRLGDAVRGNEHRLNAAFALMYLAPGTPCVYAGSEILALSDWDHAKVRAARRSKVFNSLGVYVDEQAVFDLRELHRGPLMHEQFDRAVTDQLSTVTFVKRLNSLLDMFPDWPAAELCPVMSGDVAVLAAVKQCKKTPLLCVINLSHTKKSIKLPVNQVQHVIGLDDWAAVEEFDWENNDSSDTDRKMERKKRLFRNLVGEENIEVECDVAAVYLNIDAFHHSIIHFPKT